MGSDPAGWTVYRLPRSHWHCQLDNLEWVLIHPPSLQERVHQFIVDVRAGGSPHLLLYGSPGIGKSHIGVSVYRAVCAEQGTELATWLSVPAFCEAVKNSYKEGEPDPWPDVMAARRLVVLDDLFGRELTAHEKDQIVTRLLDTAYTNGAGVLVTMNPDVNELQQRLPPHEVSRLLTNYTAIPVSGQKDWRLRAKS